MRCAKRIADMQKGTWDFSFAICRRHVTVFAGRGGTSICVRMHWAGMNEAPVN
jgi:hypothetical protein